MILKRILFIPCVLLLQWLLTFQVFGAETITFKNEPNNAIIRGEKVQYELRQEALVDPTLPLYIRITFTEGLTAINDSIQFRTLKDGTISESLVFSNKNIIYGSDGFTLLLEPPVHTTILNFSAEVESTAIDTVSCIANFLASNESIQVTQKVHNLQFKDIPLEAVVKPVSGKVTASALQKNEVRQINTRRVLYYTFLGLGTLAVILLFVGIYNYLNQKEEEERQEGTTMNPDSLLDPPIHSHDAIEDKSQEDTPR